MGSQVAIALNLVAILAKICGKWPMIAMMHRDTNLFNKACNKFQWLGKPSAKSHMPHHIDLLLRHMNALLIKLVTSIL